MGVSQDLSNKLVEGILNRDNNAEFERLLEASKSRHIHNDLPKRAEDITDMQLKDVTAKIQKLRNDVLAFNSGDPAKREHDYRKLSEACVKYSIALDRINVIGRESLRALRKEKLMEIDSISTELVSQYESNGSAPTVSS